MEEQRAGDWHEVSHNERVARWENVERVYLSLDEHARAKHFDMEHWILSNDCGTVGCIAGHCALDPYFRNLGLRPTEIKTESGETLYYEGRIPSIARSILGWDGFERVLRFSDYMNEERRKRDASDQPYEEIKAPTWEQMGPYLRKFIEDLKAGKISRRDENYGRYGYSYTDDEGRVLPIEERA